MGDFELMTQFLEEAFAGASILIIGKNVAIGSYTIGKGAIYVRQLIPTALKSVAVDTVVFLDEPTQTVRENCIERTRGFRCCRIFNIYEEKS